MSNPKRSCSLIAVLAIASTACGVGNEEELEVESEERALSQVEVATAAPEEEFYLRCSATSYAFDERSHLTDDGNGSSQSLTVEVSASSIVQHGDLCVLSSKSGRAADGRHAWLHHYTSFTPVCVSEEVTLRKTAWPWPFHVAYPSAGRYRATYDSVARKLIIVPASPKEHVFSAVARFGDTVNWRPRDASRWAVKVDEGDARYALERSDYSSQGGKLGEYSIFTPETYGDFVLSASARMAEDPTSNPDPDYALLFGYVDDDNYSYLSLSTRAESTQLVRVAAGQATVLARASRGGIQSSVYQHVELWRHGRSLQARVNGTEILRVNDDSPVTGQVGVGSLDDAALFDDIQAYSYRVIDTPHFALSLPTDERWSLRDAVSSVLETAYVLNLENTGWDINARMGQARYDYRYRPEGWYWFDDAQGCCALGGGLTISGGPSVVQSQLIPQSRLAASESPNVFVAISLHELGNGWYLPSPTGPEWVEWLRSESHSGFLRAEAELDMGYCADANREHQGHLAGYLSTSLDDRRLRGANVEPLLVSLREKYGWKPFRAVYDNTQAGKFEYLSSLPSDDRDNEMVLFLSRAVGEDLSQVLARELGITIRDDVRASLSSLPASDLTVLSSLPCRAPALRATPSTLALRAEADRTVAEGTLYVQAPLAWSVEAPPDASWLQVSRDGPGQASTVTVRADAQGVPAGTTLQAELVLRADAGEIDPVAIPIRFEVY